MNTTKCQICGKDFSNNFITKHIKKEHNLGPEEYYKQYINKTSNICALCGNPTRFRNVIEGYSNYCSITCVNKSKEHKIKSKQTCRKKYGVDNPSQSNIVKEKKKETTIKNHGVEYPLQSKIIKEKYKNTSIDRYGVDHPLKSVVVQGKIEETCKRKYGVKRVLQNEYFINKVKETNTKTFGTEWASQSTSIKEKQRDTYLKNYGTECIFQNDSVKEKIKKTNIEKYGTEFPSQTCTVKEKSKLTRNLTYYKRILNSQRIKDLVTPLFTLNEYNGVGVSGSEVEYKWRCNRCGNVFLDNLTNGHVPRCEICYPKIGKNISFSENELYYFIEKCGFDVVRNERNILDGKEIDIFIPEKKVGIEFDGLYYHSELYINNRMYHIQKTELANEKGVMLLHIFEDEWTQKKNIVKSIIKSKLGILDNRIYARKCDIRLVKNKQANQFLFDNHIQENINAKVHLGLYYENELVAILSMGKSRFDDRYEWEILRFCNKLDTIVIGGFSKLYKHFVDFYNPQSVISYVDRRYGKGDFYKNFGFNCNGETSPSYYYTKYNKRENRLNFQKHMLSEKLKTFDPILTEWENMQLNGYDRIWDCGNTVYTWIR